MKLSDIYIMILTAMVFLSCSKELQDDSHGVIGEQQVEINLGLTFAEIYPASSRALDGNQENRIDELSVVWFDKQGKYVHCALGLELQTNGTFASCRVLMYEGTYDIMVFANCHELIWELYPNGIPLGLSIEEFGASMVTGVSGIWNADTSSAGYKALPMWGMVTDQQISINCTVDPIQLLRSLARIDVVVDASIRSKFTMTEVNVYRNYQKGRISPHLDSDYWQSAYIVQKKSSLPTGTGLINTTGMKVTGITSGHTCAGEIYIFDTPAGSDLTNATNDENFCIVVGGEYEGEIAYYRVDFVKTEGGVQNYIDILRNHAYEVQITDLQLGGASTVEEALKGRPSNITYEITHLNKRGMNNINWDGQHYLMVETDTLSFYSQPGVRTLRIRTNHASGWQIINTESWISTDVQSGNANIDAELVVTVSQNPSSTNEREGIFTVRAGELSFDIAVIQSNLSELIIEVDKNALIFYAQPDGAQSINVTTYPIDAPRILTFTGDVVWSSFPTSPSSANTFSFEPQQNTTGTILAGIITIYITSDDGRMASQDIAVRQYPDENPFYVLPQNPYMSILQTNVSFYIAANKNWYIKRVIPVGAITLNSSGIRPPMTGQEPFTLSANNSYEDRDITVVFATDDDMVEHEVIFQQKGNEPYFHFYSGMTNYYQFEFTDYAQETEEIGFELNFPWRLETDSSISGIAGTLSHQSGSIYPCNEIATGQAEKLVITSIDYANGMGLPTAGTEFNSTIKIYNVNTGSHPSQLQGTIDIKRTIPTVFNFYSVVPENSILIPRAGTDITVTAGANVQWELRESGTMRSSTSIPAVYETNSLVFNVPENTIFNQRPTYTLSYYVAGKGTTTIGTYTQDSYEVEIKNLRNAVSEYLLGYKADTWPFTLTGNYPDLYLRAVDNNDGTVVSNTIQTPARNFGTIELSLNTLPNNTGADRRCGIQFSPDGSTWYDSGVSIRQIKDNYHFDLRVISKVDARMYGDSGDPLLNWANAMGIDTYWNNGTFYNSYNNANRENPDYTFTEPTGCGAYYEESYGVGGWRLPTSQEISMMLKAQIDGEYDFGIQEGEMFHTAYDEDLTVNRVMYIENGQIKTNIDSGNKSKLYRTRCIYWTGPKPSFP